MHDAGRTCNFSIYFGGTNFNKEPNNFTGLSLAPDTTIAGNSKVFSGLSIFFDAALTSSLQKLAVARNILNNRLFFLRMVFSSFI